MRTRFPVLVAAAAVAVSSAALAVQPRAARVAPASLFQTALRCQACHNGLVSASGETLSIGVEWRASMMANASRDPYWLAAVRRETLDHPAAAAEIEHECSRCHMPMAHVTQVAAGGRGQVFAQMPAGPTGPRSPLAADGVSCTVCHQIQDTRLGARESFTGHFAIDTVTPAEGRPAFGPYDVPVPLQRIMQSATGMRPLAGAHVRSSEMCATCHTLFTHALGDDGEVLGELAEQVPYLEWKHSAFRQTRSCQACHMPPLVGDIPVSTTLGQPRSGVSHHTFRGGNFWMLNVLDRYRPELAVTAAPTELQDQARDSVSHLQHDSAALAIEGAMRRGDRVAFDVIVTNLAGHKLPTAYPSRRVWLHIVAKDESGAVVWESGAFQPDGRIAGNDNDREPTTYEPHYREITTADQVQIFESVMGDRRGVVTTGLLSGVRYLKDNRVLPDGFDKRTAEKDIAVQGEAAEDPDFVGGSDRVRYSVPIAPGGEVTIEAELLYQSVGFRWADNLAAQRSAETDRFVGYYRSMSRATVQHMARARTRVPVTSARR